MPIEVLAFTDQHAQAPSMVVVDPGSGGEVATVALQTMVGGGSNPAHPDIKLARLRVSEPWPQGVTLDQGPQQLGPESHGWAEMARAPGDIHEIAIAWYSDPGMVGRTAFRALDTDSWTAKPVVDLDFDGRPALALEAGAGLGELGVGHAGDGYAIAWRKLVDSPGGAQAETMIAVLDPLGHVILGPHSQAVVADYPGHSPTIAWTSQAYLLATAFGDCTAQGCPAKLAVHRIRPASGDAWDDSGLDLVWGESPAATPRRPSIDSFEGRTWMVWAQSNPEDPQGRRAIQLQQLDPMGERIGEAALITDAALPTSRTTLTASPHGLLLVYAQDGDVQLGEGELGRSHIVLRQLDVDGEPLREPLPILATAYHSYGPPRAVALAEPRAVLVSWAGRSQSSGHEVVFVATLECVEETCRSAADCEADAYCEARCCAELGTCQPRPTGCYDDCPGVVACGGETFCNECEANAAGVDVADPSCPVASYTAEVLEPGAIVITKAEPLYDLCFRMMLAKPLSGGYPGIVVNDDWGVEQLAVRQGAGDCHDEYGSGWVVATAGSGAGSITLDIPDGGGLPCSADADALAHFPNSEPWAPSVGTFLFDDQPIEGCGAGM